MLVYKKLCENSRSYLREITLGGSSFFKKTNSVLNIEKFIKIKQATKEQELLLAAEKDFTKPFEAMNPLEKGVFLEDKVIKWYAKKHKVKAQHCEATFRKEKGFLSANIDGFIGEDIASAKSLIEVKTSGVPLKDISLILEDCKWQIQYYLYFFENKNCLLIYYNTYQESISTLLVEKDPILQAQIKERIKKCLNVLKDKVKSITEII